MRFKTTPDQSVDKPEILRPSFRWVDLSLASFALAGCISCMSNSDLDRNEGIRGEARAGEDFRGRPGETYRFTGNDAGSGSGNGFEWEFPEAPGKWESTLDGTVIHRIPSDWEGDYTAVFRVSGTSGISLDTLVVRLDLGLPSNSRVYAGPDTAVLADSYLALRGSALSAEGLNTEFAWDLGGTGIFLDSPDGGMRVYTPSETVPQWPCILRSRIAGLADAFDTLYVRVIRPGTPLPFGVKTDIAAGGDRDAASGNIIAVEISAADPGRILRWECDMGGTGDFQVFSGPRASFPVPVGPIAAYPVRVRALNDFGVYDTSGFSVQVSAPRSAPPRARKWYGSGGVVNQESYLDFLAMDDEPGLRFEAKPPEAGDYIKLPGNSLKWRMPNLPDPLYSVSFRAIDAEGQADSGVLLVDVRNAGEPQAVPGPRDADGSWHPQADAGPQDIDAFAGMQVALIGTAVDNDSPELILSWIPPGSTPIPVEQGEPYVAEIPEDLIDTGLIFRFRAENQDDPPSEDSITLNVVPDGWDWSFRRNTAGFSRRAYAGVTLHNGEVFVVGGQVDAPRGWSDQVWRTSDGQSWTFVAAAIPPGSRILPGLASFQGRIWMCGGRATEGMPQENVWSSEDGSTWRSEAASAPFGNTAGTSACAWKDTLWVLAGIDEPPIDARGYPTASGGTGTQPIGIWKSADGKVWNPASGALPFPPSAWARLFADGKNLMAFHPLGIWSSEDATTWTQDWSGNLEVPITPIAHRNWAYLCGRTTFRFRNREGIWRKVEMRPRGQAEYYSNRFFSDGNNKPMVFSLGGKLFATDGAWEFASPP